jgi:membrane associated rhomboid family serine protease
MKKGQFFPVGDTPVAHSKPIITYSLIALNVIIFIWSLTNFEAIIDTYGFKPAEFVLVTLFTSMFLHGGIDHIFGNMWFLFIFGDNVEDKFGKVKYIIFYLFSGLAAALVHYSTDPASVIPTIGASGAISGVLGAYLILFPKEGVHIGSLYGTGTMPAYFMIGFWFIMQLFLGTASLIGGVGSGIAFWAHIGGFIFGAAVAFVYKSVTAGKRKKR